MTQSYERFSSNSCFTIQSPLYVYSEKQNKRNRNRLRSFPGGKEGEDGQNGGGGLKGTNCGYKLNQTKGCDIQHRGI